MESYEFKLSTCYRSPELSHALLSAVASNNSTIDFETDSVSAMLDSGASSTFTPNRSDFIDGTCKELHGITISGIVSGLKATGVGSMHLNFKDYDDNPSTL